MSDGWIEIVEGGELPDFGDPVLVTDGEDYAVAYLDSALSHPGHFGGTAWFCVPGGERLSDHGFFPLRWREIPR